MNAAARSIPVEDAPTRPNDAPRRTGSSEMKVTFPGGQRVDAEYKGFVIETDQPVHAGGEGTAPAPFDLFLASIGTCAGFYVQTFLVQRNMPLDDVSLTLRTVKDPETRMIVRVEIEVALPSGFPEKYEKAIVNAIDLCSVKKHVLEAPEFSTTLVRPEKKGVKSWQGTSDSEVSSRLRRTAAPGA